MQDDALPPEITVEDIDNAPPAAAPISGDVSVSQEKVFKAFCEVSDQNAKLQLKLNELERKDRTRGILDNLIKPYAQRTFVFMCIYCGFVGLVIVCNAAGCFTQPIDTSVLEFMVGSTATTVIGLVGMVLTGIFIGARK